MGHTNFMIKVELMWFQDPGSSPKSSYRLATNTLNVTCRIKVAQHKNNHCIHFLGNNYCGPR